MFNQQHITDAIAVLTASVKGVFARPAPDVTIYDTYERALALKAEQAAELLKTKRAVARHRMGAKHISHPNYRFDPRHSPDPSIYPHFRVPYLNEVRDAAEVARSDNPMHLKHIAHMFHLGNQRQTTQGA
jgi:hypothetical protein